MFPPTDGDRMTITQQRRSPHADYFSSNEFTAVTDIYFIIRKVRPYLFKLEVRRAGKREESTFRNEFSN